jgi:hypothetical protein
MEKKRPDIYLFNPTCEYAVANGYASWQPNRLLQKMEEDLGTIPLFLTRPTDVVLVKKVPPPEFLTALEKIGITPPRFIPADEIAGNRQFIAEPKQRLLPWGWSPAVHRLLTPLKNSCAEDFKKSPVFKWKPKYREIYSKKFALGILKVLLPELPAEKVLPPHLTPKVCLTKAELKASLLRWGKIMVKSPWSSSGRGLQQVTKTPVVEKVWEKLLGIINEQGYAIAEPLLDKVLDVAFQFELKQGKVSYLGISRFVTDSKGQYQGNFLNGWPAGLDATVLHFAESLPELVVEPLIKTIENSLLAKYYEGNFGVDTLIFRDETGNLRVNPCLEINVRQNMGLLSLQLEKLFFPKMKGVFKTFYRQGESFGQFTRQMEINHQLQLQDGRIRSGFYALTPAFMDSKFGAYLLIPE